MNINGGFHCHCWKNFVVHQNRYCILNTTSNETNQLYFINNNHFHTLKLHWNNNAKIDTLNYSGLFKIYDESAITFNDSINSTMHSFMFDYNINYNYYIVSNRMGHFYMDRLNKELPIKLKNVSIPTVMAQCKHRVQNLALDWINHLLYLINKDNNRIEVFKIVRPNHVYVVANDLFRPQDIEVNPIESWIVWSEHNKIVQLSQDGLQKTILFENPNSFPLGLTIDYLSENIYWLDGYSHSINSINFDGHNQRELLVSKKYLQNPFDVDIFDNFLFWNDINTGMVYFINKFGKYLICLIKFNF